jgi:hypothetical protein
MSGPLVNANARRATGRREESISERHYRLAGVSQATLAVWQQEATRLLSEYRRTGNAAHLKAFRVHRGAMGGRLRGKETVR